MVRGSGGPSISKLQRLDPSTHMYEICAVIGVNYPVVYEVRKPTAEYQKFIWVSKSEMKSFTAKHSAEFVPFSLRGSCNIMTAPMAGFPRGIGLCFKPTTPFPLATTTTLPTCSFEAYGSSMKTASMGIRLFPLILTRTWRS
ncbi:MAG: hypothetical protein LLG04_15295 [Parachlamydia sp.]|nr:hypothetical protein [Parachlamydia sp.]